MSDVRCERRDAAIWLTIDRPAARNALTATVLAELAEGLGRVASDRSVRAVVLTGAGDRAFCAGADLRASTQGASAPSVSYPDVLRALLACPVPVIARVNGHCLAGGMGLLAACDLAIAVDDARFGLPEVNVGLFAFQVSAVLRPLLGARRFAELAYGGEPIDAHTAREYGLVNTVAPAHEFDAAVAALVGRIVAASPAAQRAGKRALRETDGLALDDAFAQLAGAFAELAASDDAREGRAAFAEGRPPSWSS